MGSGRRRGAGQRVWAGCDADGDRCGSWSEESVVRPRVAPRPWRGNAAFGQRKA